MAKTLRELDIEVPEWVEQDLDTDSIEAICQGGCASGAYMPAVTYYRARQTMADHGDAVLQYIEDQLGELLQPNAGESWSGIAVYYLSTAVELWASNVQAEINSNDE